MPTNVLRIQWDELSDLFKFEFEEILKLAASIEPTKQNVLKVLAVSSFLPSGCVATSCCKFQNNIKTFVVTFLQLNIQLKIFNIIKITEICTTNQ